MSFFKKIKQSMGIGTISFELEIPASVSASEGQIAGTIILTAKSAQVVKDVEVELERIHTWDERESYLNSTTNRYEDRWVERTNRVRIAHFKDASQRTLAENEVLRIPFTLSFLPTQNPYGNGPGADSLWDFISPALQVGTGWRGEKIEYRVSGDADVEDAAFDKGDSRPITLM